MLLIVNGKIHYEKLADRTVSNLCRAIHYRLARARVAHLQAKSWPSGWLQVLDALTGEHQTRYGFHPDNPEYQDHCYAILRDLYRLPYHTMDVDLLENILQNILAVEDSYTFSHRVPM